MYFDITYIVLVLPAVLFALIAQAIVKGTFNKYQRTQSMSGLTGAEAAKMVLNANGIYNVGIEQISGSLTDHYDPKANVIRLSDTVYNNPSTAAIGVAAHEAGHAIQHAEGYLPNKIRTAIVPVTNIGSKLAIPLVIVGLVFTVRIPDFIYISYIGIICFALCAFFQLVTLPTEFNASKRALRTLTDSNRLPENEIRGARKVLTAAALTYVAALAVSLMQLLRLILLVNGGRSRRR